ncbi:MAG: DUF554 domain-containing protein [Chloroflexi bacterium]|nr:DUF554 domain-containing protein [Chloroflexota bacterium]
MTGTLINIITVLIGGTLGTFLGARLPEKIRETVMAAVGLVVLVIGFEMALSSQNILIPMFSVLIGGVIGEMMRIEDGLNAFGRWLEERTQHWFGEDERSVTRAFVTASLVFCVGPLTVLGAIQDGLTGDYQLLAVKSVLDGFTSLAFAATLGPGVLLSVITLLLYQGGISLLAMAFGTAMGEVTRTTPWVLEMTAAGGILVLGIGLGLLEIKRVRVGNLLPAVLIAPLIVVLLAWIR